MMRGHLHSRNIYVQRRRLRASLHRVDSNGIAARRLFTISRRRYNVPSPNYLWHIDGTHKLIKWKLVVHAGIDGYSRLIVYCRCSANNRSTTVLRLFEEGVATYGLPLKVRTDHGGENSRVWSLMLEKYLNTNAVLVGSSIHNQRIERFNRDINTQVLNFYVNLFMHLEERELLNPENETDIYVLHFVFLPRINEQLDEFRHAYNNHPLSTVCHYTPLQLHSTNLRLLELQHLNPAGSISPDSITHPHVNSVQVIPPINPLSQWEKQNLLDLLANNKHLSLVSLYKLASEFVCNCIEARLDPR